MSKKQYYIPFSIVPRYNKECNELLFYIPLASFMTDITFKDYFISNHNKPTTNYKSIHFIMNNKELNEEEIQNYIISDPKNEIVIFYQDKKELFESHYFIKVVLNNPIDREYNFPELNLLHIIKTNNEINFL